MLDVRTFRGVTIGSHDHYLVAAKVRMRISQHHTAPASTEKKLDIKKLHSSQRIAEAYSAKLSEILNTPNLQPDDPGGIWAHISHSIRTAAESTIGFERRQHSKQWYDEECREAAAAKVAAYKKTLQPSATRSTWEQFRERRREESRLKRRKQREFERREREELEELHDRNEIRKFYQRVNRLSQGFKPKPSNCRDNNGNLVVDTQSALRL